MVVELLNNIWLVFLDTAFWLLIGLLAAGVIKSFIAEDTMQRWVGGRGIGSILRAALFGAPLPLCSCGVLPAAIGLHRAGASKEATVSPSKLMEQEIPQILMEAKTKEGVYEPKLATEKIIAATEDNPELHEKLHIL